MFKSNDSVDDDDEFDVLSGKKPQKMKRKEESKFKNIAMSIAANKIFDEKKTTEEDKSHFVAGDLLDIAKLVISSDDEENEDENKGDSKKKKKEKKKKEKKKKDKKNKNKKSIENELEELRIQLKDRDDSITEKDEIIDNQKIQLESYQTELVESKGMIRSLQEEIMKLKEELEIQHQQSKKPNKVPMSKPVVKKRPDTGRGKKAPPPVPGKKKGPPPPLPRKRFQK